MLSYKFNLRDYQNKNIKIAPISKIYILKTIICYIIELIVIITDLLIKHSDLNICYTKR